MEIKTRRQEGRERKKINAVYKYLQTGSVSSLCCITKNYKAYIIIYSTFVAVNKTKVVKVKLSLCTP
jgi:hypothetical protein